MGIVFLATSKFLVPINLALANHAALLMIMKVSLIILSILCTVGILHHF